MEQDNTRLTRANKASAARFYKMVSNTDNIIARGKNVDNFI